MDVAREELPRSKSANIRWTAFKALLNLWEIYGSRFDFDRCCGMWVGDLVCISGKTETEKLEVKNESITAYTIKSGAAV